MITDALLRDPVRHARELFGVEPWARQVDILWAVSERREVNVPSCHSAGKSWTAALATLLFATRHVDSIIVTSAPTDRQVRLILWKEIASLYNGARIPIGGRLLTQKLELGNEWWAIGFTADDTKPDSFQGIHSKSGHVLVVLDEACGITQGIYEAARSLASGEHGRILAIANPTNPVCEFARSCELNGSLPISAFDTPNFTHFGIQLQHIADGSWRTRIDGQSYPHPYLCTPDWVEYMYLRWGADSPMFLSRVLGRFPTSSEWSAIPLEWISRSQTREMAGRPVIGIDVARSGDNETVVARRLGTFVNVLWSGRTPSVTGAVPTIASILRREDPIEIRVDADGVGGPLADALRPEFGHRVVDVHGSAAPSDKSRFANARAENWWTLREGIERGEIALDTADEELVLQCSSVRYHVNRGPILIEGKEDMRRRGVPSPDRADAAVLACAPSRRHRLVLC